MQGRLQTRFSEAEYLAMEHVSEERHEFVNGGIYAMSGASPAHNVIAGNVAERLRGGLRAAGRRCLVMQSDQRVHVPTTGTYLYPDVVVVCGRPEVHPRDAHAVVNPLLVVEVLSESTEDCDRGAKLAHYRAIPALEAILLVAQSERRVELWRRVDASNWMFAEAREGLVPVASLGLDLQVDELYADLDLL